MSNMVEVKTSELSINAIHWLLAEIQGMKSRIYMCPVMGEYCVAATPADSEIEDAWIPTLDWDQCGLLIETFFPTFSHVNGLIRAEVIVMSGENFFALSDSYMESACRAIVASKLGDTVQIPAELLP